MWNREWAYIYIYIYIYVCANASVWVDDRLPSVRGVLSFPHLDPGVRISQLLTLPMDVCVCVHVDVCSVCVCVGYGV